MKNNFLSKAVPRGTRTIWRYLGALFLIFTLGIGQMWGTATNFHDFVAAGDTIIDLEGSGSTPSAKFTAVNNTDWASVSTSAKNATVKRIDPSTGATATSTSNVYGTKLNSSNKTILKVQGVTGVSYYIGGGSSRKGYLNVEADGGDKWTQIESSALSTNCAVMTCTLDKDSSYTLTLSASGDIFCYAIKITVASKCTKPGTPTALAAGSVTHNSASLSWTAGANNNGHKIYIEKKSDKTKVLDWTDATSPYAASGLDPETTYTFKVKAKGATGYCDLGDEASADFATEVDPSATTYKVTLVPAGGTISDATGWTLNAGNYEKEVSDGTELTLPTFTKDNRTFKTWRNGAVDVTSPITVTADVTLTAVWAATVEQVIYSWESPDGTAVEVGGTAITKDQDGNTVEGNGNVNATLTNVTVAYKAIMLNGKISSNAWSGNYIQITTDEAVKAGDKVKVTACTTKGDTSKKGSAQMRAGASATSTAIFTDGNSYNDILADGTLIPNTKTFTVPDGVNTSTLTMTRSQSNTNCWVTKLQIIREVQVEEGDLLTVTFDANGGSAIAPVVVASGQAVAKPADPTKAHNRFKEWQLSGSAYNFSTPVTSNITLVANWTPLYTVTYAANGGSGTMTDANEYAAGDEVTLLTNTFDAPDASKIWDSWAVTDASDNSVAVSEGKFSMPNSAATVTAQWATISDFDVKFFQGYGDPDVQIGTTQTVSTGNYATAPAEDPERAGFAFLGWSYDATEAHIVDVATYGITAATNFTAMWKAVWTVTFDGAGAVNVEDGEAVASPNSPVMAGKVFQGWYNAEVKYDFSAAVTGNLALTSKWADADPNHYVYAYNDDFHFDGVVYKTPEGAVDGGSGTSNIPMTTPYTLFEGAEGITSIVMTDGIYDSKTGAIQAVTALMKVNNNATSKLTVTIKSGYTATLKIKSSGYSAARTISVTDATPASGTTTGQAVTSGAMSVSGIGELSFALNSGSHDLTVTGGTLYIAELDIEATALPAHTVTYMPGEGTGAEFIDDDATEVSDGSTMFTAPEGKIFNGWKDGDNNDVEVGTIVTGDMTLTAQWINHYAVTFNLQGHGDAIDPQDIKEGAKATKPADPVVMGWDFGGWFTDAECTAGNEFDFETPITAATPLFAKWTEFEGCALLYPALSGDALHVGVNVAVQTGSKGGSIAVVGMKEDGSISYNANGLFLSGGSADVISVTLNNDIAVGTKISVTLVAANTGSRGLNLLNATGGKVKGGTKLGWDDATLGEVGTFSYTVEASDGLEGTNIFRLQRNNSVYLQCVKVESCGAAITYHNLTSEVNIAGKGTVTLGATSVREGYTTTATYSEIDPLYEFVNWTVSGAGASIADASANPATITMGTENAVVTLNLRLIPVKFTVEYYDGATLMGSEQVAVNEYPTASEIVTAKRHYTFLGWSDTDGGDVVALNTITRAEAGTVKLYAKYEAVACPTSGTIFSMESDEAKKPASTVTIAKDASIDLAEYATISGGNAMIINGETSGKDAISTDGEFLLKATKEVMKIELNCVLQEGDIIRIPDNSAKLVISTSNAKTGTYQAFADKNTHEFAVTAAWAGVDDIYVLYDGSSLKFTKVYVIRPAKYTVSFNLMGHGSVIADIADVLEGSKIPAPTAPTDEDYSFAGWYKENTLANEWKFDVDVVEANTTLYAKWLDKSDATLKSLKYGSTDIALEDGVFEYNIALAAATVAVPALTAVTNNPAATAVVTDDDAFDGDGKATSTVEVTPQKEGAAHLTYTVNFSKLAALPQVNVTGFTTWNFSAGGSTTLTNQSDVVLANLPGINNDENFNSQALLGSFNKMEGTYFQGSKLSFTTEVPGKLTITFRGTNGNTRHLQACVGDGETVVADWVYNSSSTSQTKTIFVPEGKVTLKAFEGETPNNARIYNMTFNATPDYPRDVTEGRYGTICLPNSGVMTGADIFEIAYFEPSSSKIFFDQIVNGVMEAGMPYIFLPKAGATQLGVFYTDEANASAGHHNGLYGSYAQTELGTDGSNYILLNNQYCQVINERVYVGANRAYIKLNEVSGTAVAPAPGRRRISMSVQGEQIATGIESAEANEAPRKVLINGELFILRGEKMYDAKGQLVK